MNSALYTFKPNPLRKWILLSIFAFGTVLIPIFSLVMSYSVGTLNIWIILGLGVLALVGIFFCVAVLKTKIEMFRDEMVIHSIFKKKTIKYKNIHRISFKKELTGDSDDYSHSYYFLLEFKNSRTNNVPSIDTDFKINGVELAYKIDLKTLDSLKYKQFFLNTILKSNPTVQLDNITLDYKEGKDPGVMKHGSLVD